MYDYLNVENYFLNN